MDKKMELNEEQLVIREKILTKMKDEIQGLEQDIKNLKIKNLKINTKRFFKMSICTLRLVTPYVVTAAFTLWLFSLGNIFPFKENYEKKCLKVKKEIDNKGNISFEEQYENFDNINTTISYYGKWIKKDENFYTREIKIYNIKNIYGKELIERHFSDIDIKTLEEIIGNPILTKYETKNNLTEEELENDFYIKMVVFSEVDDDFIIIKAPIEVDIAASMIWVIITFILSKLASLLANTTSNFNYASSINNIKEQYPTIDIDSIIEKLEIRKGNYKRLTR